MLPDEVAETEESLRQAATERFRGAVQAARAIGDPAATKRAIKAASEAFFVAVGEVARKFPRDARAK
jgi:hypothetical protein